MAVSKTRKHLPFKFAFQAIGSKSIFTGQIDNQIISKEIKNAPESRNVIDFILKYI